MSVVATDLDTAAGGVASQRARVCALRLMWHGAQVKAHLAASVSSSGLVYSSALGLRLFHDGYSTNWKTAFPLIHARAAVPRLPNSNKAHCGGIVVGLW